MFCKQCGAEISQNSKFCTRCGAPSSTAVTNAKSKGKNIIISVVLCMTIVIFSIFSLSLITFKSGLTDEKISNFVNNLNIKVAFQDNDIINFAKNSATIEDIERIYKNGTFKIFIKNNLIEYSNYLLNGELPNGISSDDIVNLMKDNADTIEKICGYELKEKDYKSIQRYFDKEGAKVLEFFSSDIALNQYTEALRLLCSGKTIVIFVILSFLLIFLLFKARGYEPDFFLWLAIVLSVSVAFYDILIVYLSNTNYIITLYIRNVSGSILKYSSVFISLSCILYFCYIIGKKYKRLKEINFEI